jgi:sarcosine oxidase subunit alpha
VTAPSFRLPAGGRVDRDRPLSFRFNGRPYRGLAGDTLASALLANGVHLVGRSFKYHRPRGILAAGAEEANALVQLGEGGRSEPNRLATQVELFDGLRARSQNCWPMVEFDLGAASGLLSALVPAGFYYKTFMWPRRFWMHYESVIRHLAGMGRAPVARDPDRYDKRYAHTDVLVVGGGPAGLAAAAAAGQSGARVLLLCCRAPRCSAITTTITCARSSG